MFDPRQALWLPSGSIRAILALVLVLAVVILAFTGALEGREVVVLASVAVGFYFGKAPTPPSSPSSPS